MTAAIPQTNEFLIQRVRDCTAHGAWREFFDLYWRFIMRYAQKQGLNEHDAEEVLQETMAFLMESLRDFEYDKAKGRFRQYLLAIVHRKCQEQRRGGWRQMAAMDKLADNITLPPEPPTPVQGEEELLMAVLKEEALLRVRERVTPDNFSIFVDLMRGDRTVAELAKLHDKNANSIYQIQNRCLRYFEQELSELRRKLLD